MSTGGFAASDSFGDATAPTSAAGRRVPLHRLIGVAFTLLIVAAGGAIGWHNYVQNRDLTIAAADGLFAALARETHAEFEAIRHPAEMLVELFARQRVAAATTLDERLASVPFLVAALGEASAVSAAYAGYASGDFFLLRRLTAAPGHAAFAPPAGAAYLAQSIERDAQGGSRGAYVFFDTAGRVLERRAAPDYAFDPRTRGWYREALAAGRRVRTAPYVFFTTREVGITLARPSEIGPAVVAADVTLADLAHTLERHPLPPSSELLLVTADGAVAAERRRGRSVVEAKGDGTLRVARLGELGSPPLDALMARFDPGAASQRVAFAAGGREWEAAVLPVGRGDQPERAYLVLAMARDELLAGASRITRSSALLTLFIVLACIPIAWLLSRRISGPLWRLTAETGAVRRFDFAGPVAVRSAIAEIGELAGAVDSMKRTIRRFLDIAATIAGERKFDRLLARVLAEVLPVTGSSAGAIYLADDAGQMRQVAARRSAAGDAASVDARGDAVDTGHVAMRAAAARRTLVERLAPEGGAIVRDFGPVGAAGDGASLVVVAIPLTDRQGESAGALCLFQDVAQGDPSPERIAFAEALSGTIAVALQNQALLLAQKELLEAFIRLVAGAIDAKSPYTGGHCQRVPELTRLLAQAACEARDGPFRDFTMSDDEWEALRIATWLHDCGKVTTPEFVVDKATKLETIYDRLHEIRVRFEVIKRDAAVGCWRRIADGGDRAALERDLAARLAELDAEFAFVAACNEGSEAMPPEHVERLRRIGRRTWQRTLDDRIGIGRDERERKSRVPAGPLPVTEFLLADKPEHLVAHDTSDRLPPDNRWGFRVDRPAHKADLGEIHNLSVGRGTLTAEDRYRINDHITRTIIMLSELPFTGHLRRVPEIAGGHHERMDGKGYPKGLKGSEMSVQARMMAIADVFEALTAADRPYKKAKPLSESIAIMARMRDDHHLDPDLFELFLTSGVYCKYAAQFLDPAQIDAVDVSAALRTAGSP